MAVHYLFGMRSRFVFGTRQRYLATTAAWAMALVLYSLIFPTFESPDEQAHVDMILFHEAAGLDTIDNRGRLLSPAVEAAMVASQFWTDPRPAGRSLPYRDRQPFRELGAYQAATGTVNYTQQAPSMYYYTLAAQSRLVQSIIPGQPLAFDEHVWLLRLLSASLLVPVPWLVGLSARALGANPQAEQAAMFVPFLFPQLLHIGGAVNNDDAALLFAAIATAGMLSLARGNASVRVALVTGFGLGLSVLSKGTALTLLPSVALALFAGGHMRRASSFRVTAAVAVSSFVTGGWFYAANLVEHGTVLRSVSPPQYAENDAFVPATADYFRTWFPRVSERYIGWFGWFDVRLPSWAYILLVTTTIVLVIVGVLEIRNRVALVALMPLLVAVPVLLNANYRLYASTGLPAGIQGRYLFVASVGVWALAGIGAVAVGRRVGSAQLGVSFVIVCGAAINWLALRRVLSYYWGGDSLNSQLRTWAAYTPIQGVWSAVIVVVAGVALASAAGLAMLDPALRDEPSGPRANVNDR